MMSLSRSAVVLLLLAVWPVPAGRCEDEPEALRVDATVAIHQRPGTTRIEVAPDGRARITHTIPGGAQPDLVLSIRLTEVELDEGRRAVRAARWFAPWTSKASPLHASHWRVDVSLGKAHRTRTPSEMSSEFDPLRRYLLRYVELAACVRALRLGRADPARRLLRPDNRHRLVQPSALAPEIVASAAAHTNPDGEPAIALLLVALPDPAVWRGAAARLLSVLEDPQRDIVLAHWVGALRHEGRRAHREAFLPIALTEVLATTQGWTDMDSVQRRAFASLLALLLQARVPEAFGIAEQMARVASTPEKPIVPPGLLATGEAAIPILLRLLDAPEDGARASGAKMAYQLVRFVRGQMHIGLELTPEARAALERRLGTEVIPRLEKLVETLDGSHAARTACVEALDAWDGRVKAARAAARAEHEAARERAAAERRTPGPTRPAAGTEVIAGRLLGPSDLPLPGFGVHAASRTGGSRGSAVTAEDGSFRIEGLAAGPHDLAYTVPGQSARWAWARSRPTAAGVAAGTRDVALRLPGSLIRGHLVDAEGEAVGGRRLVAQMRDAPSGQGPAYGSAFANTDAQGRFWLVQLLPGTYDLTVPGHPALRGARGIVAGPEARTVTLRPGAAITGRLVDEAGEPIAAASVTATPADAPHDVLQSTQTRPDGTFRFGHLDPAVTLRITAQLTPPARRHVVREEVAPGTTDLELRMVTTPRLRFRVDFGKRTAGGGRVRVERIQGGSPIRETFEGRTVNWRAAPAGTWRVYAWVRDLDATGQPILRWLAIGTATTGEPETTLSVPQ